MKITILITYALIIAVPALSPAILILPNFGRSRCIGAVVDVATIFLGKISGIGMIFASASAQLA